MNFWVAIILGILVWSVIKAWDELATTRKRLEDLTRMLYGHNIITLIDVSEEANLYEGIDESILKGWAVSSFAIRVATPGVDWDKEKRLVQAYLKAIKGDFRKFNKLDEEDKTRFYKAIETMKAKAAINSEYWNRIYKEYYPSDVEQKKIVKKLFPEESDELEEQIDSIGL
ncbi:MAG: hypothetical protein ABH880_02065 [Patescibacteria group bacterium]